jgi:putative transposase
MRKQKLVSNNIYHVFNRGVEKRQTFMDEHDYLRFVNNLAIFNDENPVLNAKYRAKKMGLIKDDDREPLVDILAFCLMPNHFHLLLRQKKETGISRFMNKIGVGYTNYFNMKYERVGSLFQGTFKAVLIDEESQFLYIPYYIHSNPLDLIFPNRQNTGISKLKLESAIDFLKSYKWSSHGDYIGMPNFTKIINPDFLNEIFISPENYQKEFKRFIKDSDFSEMSDLLIDSIDSKNR